MYAYTVSVFTVCSYFPDSYSEMVTPKKRLEDVLHLAELCIEVLQQNEEHHAEVEYIYIHVYHIDFFFHHVFPLDKCQFSSLENPLLNVLIKIYVGFPLV